MLVKQELRPRTGQESLCTTGCMETTAGIRKILSLPKNSRPVKLVVSAIPGYRLVTEATTFPSRHAYNDYLRFLSLSVKENEGNTIFIEICSI